MEPEARDIVSVWRGPPIYPAEPPFSPSFVPPELPSIAAGSPGANSAFEGVRECLRLAGLDAEHFGTADWNPLRAYIHPGQTVLLKPNWVHHRHPRDPEGWRYTVTHGSIVRAVAEYVVKALGRRGRILVGDAPQTDADFDLIAERTGTRAVANYFRASGLDFSLLDFRRERWIERRGVIVDRLPLPGDPAGYVRFDLGSRSRFAEHGGAGRYYGAFYDEGEVNLHHSDGRQEYLLSGSAVDADVFINLPKLKTHKKTGVTISLKNLVGINGDKNWLPHHTEGYPANGGDQFPEESTIRRIERATLKRLRRLAVALPGLGPRVLAAARQAGAHIAGDSDSVVRSGNWYGNDTTWRMALDLNAALLFGRRDGSFRDPAAAKPYLTFVDGILAGQGSGPLNPDPVAAGVIAFGANAASVDAACAWLMGFDPDRIALIREAYRTHPLQLAYGSWRDVVVASNVEDWNGTLPAIDDRACFRFRPHFGWSGAIERRGGP